MVKLLDEHERTLAFAEVALGQIRSLRQTAVPRNYEIWYVYATGYNAPLNKIINETLAQSGSSFHAALVEMGQKWRDMSAGSVKLTIYPDGTQGGEADMVRMMRAGILTAGMFTVVGLSEIDPSVGGLSFLPLTFRTWEEYDYVVEKLSPRLEKLLSDKGFIVLFWGDAGIGMAIMGSGLGRNNAYLGDCDIQLFDLAIFAQSVDELLASIE